jgi:hypothetical protein
MNKTRKHAQGDVVMVRYADDVVLGFQKHRDARECLSALKQRLGKFGLKVHPEKTRLVRFGRFALSHYREERGSPERLIFWDLPTTLDKTGQAARW